MRVINHSDQTSVNWKCPDCQRLICVDDIGLTVGLFSLTLTCPYCNYSQTKHTLFRSLPDFSEWIDERAKNTEMEEEDDNRD